MANTYVDYTATAGQTDFNFSFPFLENDHVEVFIDGVKSTAFTISLSPTRVVLDTAATGGETVRVRRSSDPTEDLVDFVNGSILTESDLDRAYLHNRYLNEEAFEGNTSSLQTAAGSTNFDANFNKIINLAPPTNSTDAAHKDYVDDKLSLSGTSLSGFNKSTHTGDNATTTFTLSFTPQTGTASAFRVAIDGVLQTPDDAYTVNSSTSQITFTSAPPTNAEIVVVATGTAQDVNSIGVTATGSTEARSLADRFADVVNVLDYGADPTGDTDSTSAIQAVLDSMTAYGSVQNSGSFQEEVTIVIPDGTYMISSPLTRTYRNNFRIIGSGELKASTGFSGGDYLLELIACSHLQITGIKFNGNNYSCKSALRLSGDGFTGTKKNSTNIKVEKCFFYEFGATGTDGYVVDTLSPNNTPGDYSIDDSSFIHCNWLGSYGGGIRLASSEIQIVGGKMSFVGLDGTLPMVNLGNGSSLNLSDFVFTGPGASAPFFMLKADTGASIGRVKASGVYSEGTDKPFYYQDSGTCRSLNIQGGYFAGTPDASTPFIEFLNGCQAQVAMYGNTFQSNGYTTIQLGGSGSLVGDLQTSKTAFKSYVPAVVGGVFTADVMGAQPSQSGMTDKKRYLKAIHDVQNATELEIHVDLSLAEDNPWKLTFSSFQNAVKYIDQIGYTKCKIVLDDGTSHTIDEDITICGDVQTTGSSLTWTITGQISVKAGGFLRISGTITYDNHAFVNRGGNILFYFATLSGNSSTDYLVNHEGGFTSFVSCTNNTQGNLCSIDSYQSLGEIHLTEHTFNSDPNITDNDPNRIINLVYHSDSAPTRGYWRMGSYVEKISPTASGHIGFVCVTGGTPGTWKSYGSISA